MSAPSFRNRQRGLSLTGLVGIVAVGGFLALLGMQCIPAWTEYMSIKRAVKALEDAGASDESELRRLFNQRRSAEYIESIDGRDLVLQRTGSTSWTIGFSYEKRVPLVGNASLVFDFSN